MYLRLKKLLEGGKKLTLAILKEFIR